MNLAVIGAGIGGCSAAYFARKYLPYSKVTVYERGNRVGGRVLTFDEGQKKSELGAAFLNSTNRTVCDLVKEMKLEVKKLEDATDIAVWNGTEIIFKSSQPMFYNLLKLIASYKLSVPKMLFGLREAKKKIERFYRKEKPAEFWELFESAGLDRWYRKRFDQILVEMGIDSKFIDEIVTPITRIIYSQDAALGGFAGLSSLLGVYGGSIYRLMEGNDVLPRRLHEASDSKVKLDSKVESVERTSKGSYRVIARDNTSIVDGVIIATPLEAADITFEGVATQEPQAREYQKIYIKLMKGEVNSRYFNLDKSAELPAMILTTKEADPITRFSINKATKDESLVTVTSKEPIGNDILGEIFKNGRTILDHTWSAAYPVFKPTERLPSTFLGKGLIFLNAIESAASSLESSTFAALNGIKMMKKQFNS
ncbi:prenylcysteine oxidase family protein [Candidatus Bathyarchaeota archaeon]|nr:prenylcysteine oxidase family protein [Candidatus Bathyarchaeota archaeon]